MASSSAIVAAASRSPMALLTVTRFARRPAGTAASSSGEDAVAADVFALIRSFLLLSSLVTLGQSAALSQSQGFVISFLGSSTGWWAGTPATLLPGKKEIAKGTSKKINTEPRGLT